MHCFNPAIAAKYGVNEAIIIQSFQFWINNNKRNGRNEQEGRTWTFNSTKALQESFPYMTEKQIWLAIDRLVKAGVLMKGNFNTHKYDRTSWYAFTLESFWICPEGKFHFPWEENAVPPNSEPIPVTNPVTDPATESLGAKAPSKKKHASQKKGEEKGKDPDWQRWVDRYEEHVKKHNNHIGHRWDGSQLGPQGIKGIREHLVKIAHKKEGASADDCGFEAWGYILDNWENLRDEFLQREFDLTVILKKITNIINRLKDAGSKTNRGTTAAGGTSQQRVDAVQNY